MSEKCMDVETINSLEQALEDIAVMRPAFTVDASSVQAKTQAAIAGLGKNLISQG